MPYFVSVPLVSIVIVNYNYGKYIFDAIQSVKDQIYQNIECIIVDNNSTDDSLAIIKSATDGDPRFALFRLPQNLGHLGGALEAIDRTKGEFVVFLDADDVLLPGFVASHLQVHLGSNFATGFTSSAVIETNAVGAHVGSGNVNLQVSWNTAQRSLRDDTVTVRLEVISSAAYAQLDAVTRYIEYTRVGWLWSAGTANMMRRHMLLRLRPLVPPGTPIFGGVDGYFLPMLHAISGTHLINLPLSTYRIHGSNDFSTDASVANGMVATEKGVAQAYNIHRLSLISLFARYDDLPIWRPNFWTVLRTLLANYYLRDALDDPSVLAAIADCFPSLVETFDEKTTLDELYQIMGRKRMARLLSATAHGRAGWRVALVLHRTTLRRNLKRVTDVFYHLRRRLIR